ncbi:hypothetical protein FO440_22310 [Mucilaginibacter corticis]|uniref:Uncharacterized protein n=1 Tax=Mucilaginibacter corticis TaxID=2597670 RepID=A0A556M9G7_9SPHI|nr:hypothetical protein [Mucilaginibacter corticis]TSJ36564.1 hypothetical protein FO440_22310 [Mucilaginibacter corticis]
MNSIAQVYRQACRELGLPPEEKQLFLKLLREISTNTIKRKKAWNVKEDFMVLWFISAGRYPELSHSPYRELIDQWIALHLPFELNEHEQALLWL